MKPEKQIDIDRLFAEGDAIDQAIAEGVLKALRMHKLLGNPVAEWRNNQLIVVPPNEINLDPDRSDY